MAQCQQLPLGRQVLHRIYLETCERKHENDEIITSSSIQTLIIVRERGLKMLEIVLAKFTLHLVSFPILV